MNELTKTQEKFIILQSDEWIRIKWLTGYRYKLEFNQQFKEHAQLILWCEENCENIVVYWESRHWNDADEMYFFNEADAVACKLRWM